MFISFLLLRCKRKEMEPKKRKHAGVLASCACSESVRRYRSGSHSLLCFAHARHVLSPFGREPERGRVLSHLRKISTAPRAKFRDKALTLVEMLIAIISDVKQTFYFRDDSVSRRQKRVRENKMFAFAFTLAEILCSEKLYSCAFTLAEVLIVLGIIGLIADMTIPTLVAKTQTQVTIAKLNKAYSTFESAFKMAIAQDGTPDNWGFTAGLEEHTNPNPEEFSDTPTIAFNHIAPYLKIIRDCGQTVCDTNKKIAGYSAKLADGTCFLLDVHSKDCTAIYGSTPALKNVCGTIYVNTSGEFQEGKIGYTGFHFWYTKFGLVPLGTETDTFAPFNCGKNPSEHNANIGCTAWVLYNHNMDYLKCSGLSWTGKKKCD